VGTPLIAGAKVAAEVVEHKARPQGRGVQKAQTQSLCTQSGPSQELNDFKNPEHNLKSAPFRRTRD